MSGWGRLSSGTSRSGGGRGLAEAAQTQDVQRAETLIYQGCDVEEPDQGGNTALHWATWFRLQSLIELLLERGASPAKANSSGETPVHWAAKSTNIQVLKLFTQDRPDLLSLRDVDGYTPFVIAAQMDNPAAMEWFYLQGVHVDEQDNHGRTALQWASYKGHKKAVQWLLSRQASVGHRDHEKMTALHWACLKGHDVVAELLIGVGAVRLVFEQDTGGDTAMRLAWQKKHHGIALYLVKSYVFYKLFGNPTILKTQFALFTLMAMFMNWALYILVMLPQLGWSDAGTLLLWPVFGTLALIFWVHLKLSDPGYYESQTIESQYERIQLTLENPATEQMEHVLAEQLDQDSIEYNQHKVHYQQQLIQEARRRAEDGEAEEGDLQFLNQASFTLKSKLDAARMPVAEARRQQLVDDGREEYLRLVEAGASKEVCTICRAVKKLRSHHCSELGRCIARFDHFCPWVDNAVGLRNQRAFLVWLACLEASLVLLYGLIARLFSEEIQSQGVPAASLLLAFFVGALNLLWTGFIGALILRHIVYMLCNITTFEAIVRPPHVVKRFPKKRLRVLCLEAWFLEGLGILEAVGHAVAFCTLDETHDERTYTGEDNNGAGYAAMDTEDPEAGEAET